MGAVMRGPTVATIKRLFAVAGNRCAFAGCEERLVDEGSGTIMGEVCHIKAKSCWRWVSEPTRQNCPRDWTSPPRSPFGKSGC